MQLLSTLFIMMFISFDGLIWGILIGYRKQYFPFMHFVLLTVGTALTLWIFYSIGLVLEDVIPFHFFNKLAGVFLLILSLVHLIDGEILFRRAMALKIFVIVNVDNIGFALSAGYDALNRFFPIIAGILFAAFFIIGLMMSYRNTSLKFQQMGNLLPFLILFSMGLFKLVFG